MPRPTRAGAFEFVVVLISCVVIAQSSHHEDPGRGAADEVVLQFRSDIIVKLVVYLDHSACDLIAERRWKVMPETQPHPGCRSGSQADSEHTVAELCAVFSAWNRHLRTDVRGMKRKKTRSTLFINCLFDGS